MSELKLYKTPSLVGAKDEVAVSNIIIAKASQYESNMAELQDYIGRAFNAHQKKINNLIVEKSVIEEQISQKKKEIENAKEFIALSLTSLGIDKIDDKGSDICSSVVVKEATESYIEPKERPLTVTEMKELLKANGLPTTVYEDVEVEAKPAKATINYRKNQKVKAITKKEALIISDSFIEIDNA